MQNIVDTVGTEFSLYVLLSYLFQSWHASRRHRGGDKRSESEHLRGDLPGRPQQRSNHHGGAEGTRAA